MRRTCFPVVMCSICRRGGRTLVGRATREVDRRVGLEIRRLRIDAGLSQRALAREAGIDQSYLPGIERGLAEPSLAVLQAIALALGADLSVRLFPNTGPRIHDRFQAPMLEALLRLVGPGWSRHAEVPVQSPARGVIDAVLVRPQDGLYVATEVESRIDRLEQEIRWATEKAESLPSARLWRRSPGAPAPHLSRLLLLRVTRANRELVVRYQEIVRAAYPARTNEAYRALRDEEAWPGSALLWADVIDRTATIRSLPPRGVRAGR